MLGVLQRDVREDLDRGVEQHSPAHALRMGRGELEHEAAAERMPDPVGLADSQGVGGLDEVGDVRRIRPGRLPARAAVAAQVGSDDVETLRPVLLREPPEALAVTGDAVQADERRRAGIAPFVRVQFHAVASSPLPEGS